MIFSRAINKLKEFLHPEIPPLYERSPGVTPPGSAFELPTSPDFWGFDDHYMEDRINWGIVRKQGAPRRQLRRGKYRFWKVYVVEDESDNKPNGTKTRNEKALFPKKSHFLRELFWFKPESLLLIELPASGQPEENRFETGNSFELEQPLDPEPTMEFYQTLDTQVLVNDSALDTTVATQFGTTPKLGKLKPWVKILNGTISPAELSRRNSSETVVAQPALPLTR